MEKNSIFRKFRQYKKMINNFYLNGKKVAGWAAYMIVIFSAQASEVQAS